MDKVLFIGDSHAAHLRKVIGNRPHDHWLVAPSRHPYNLSLLKADRDAIYSDHPELLKILEQYKQPAHVSLDVDRVVLVGLRSEFPYLLVQDKSPSSAVVAQAMCDYLNQQSILLRTLRLLRKHQFNGRIDVITNPLISADLRQQNIITAPGIQPVGTIIGSQLTTELTTQQRLLELWQQTIAAQLEPLSAEHVQQPEQTIEGFFTNSNYALGKKSAGELRHMNADYWQLFTKNGWLS